MLHNCKRKSEIIGVDSVNAGVTAERLFDQGYSLGWCGQVSRLKEEDRGGGETDAGVLLI
jgi:hypothetical protein